MARSAGLKRAVALATPLAVAAAVAEQTPDGLVDLLIGEYNNNEQVWQQNLDGEAQVRRMHWRLTRMGDHRVGVSKGYGQSAPAEPRWIFTFDGAVASVASDGRTACAYHWHEFPGVAADDEPEPAGVSQPGESGRHGGMPLRAELSSGGYMGARDDAHDCPGDLPLKLYVTHSHLVAMYGHGVDMGAYPIRARRVMCYTGWIAFARRHIDPDAANDDFILMRDLALHDEGFVVAITDAGTPTGYAVELARLTYQNTRTAVVKLGVVDQSTGNTVSYSWAAPGAERIGINLRWVQAGMTRSC